MRTLRIHIAVLAAALAAPALALTPDVRFQGIAHDALFSVDVDGEQALAVGAAGTILQSDDAGQTWSLVPDVPTDFALNGVAVRGNQAVAVGQMGVILYRDATGHWQEAASGTEERLMQVAAGADGQVVAVGAFGSLLVSDDAGKSWASAAPDWTTMTDQGFEPHLYAVDVADSGAVTVAGEFGLILRSADGHSNWTVLREGEASIFGMHLRADGLGYAVGQSGTVLKTSDGGATWAAAAEPGKVVWLNVRADARGRVFIAGIREMATSDDGGSNWDSPGGGSSSGGSSGSGSGSGGGADLDDEIPF